MSLHLGGALAPYACHPDRSRGRRYKEPSAPTRNVFQRDRDRIIHSASFRRLVYKTQVFLNHEGDLFRTRLTHSLEVAQLARSMARSLALNEDLVEAIALAHDLGHTPFGHAGQEALNECLINTPLTPHQQGFEHNLQSLRVVDYLEQPYPEFEGLNLTFETREGILKHCSLDNAKRIEALEPHGVAHRFIAKTQASLEAQLCNLADEIAYNTHDIDDGLRSGLITFDNLKTLGPWFKHFEAVCQQYPNLSHRRLSYAVFRRLLSEQVYDLIQTSQQAIQASGVDSVEAVRAHGRRLIGFSPEIQNEVKAIKHFLFHSLYRHPQVVYNLQQAKQVVQALFDFYMQNPHALPQDSELSSLSLVQRVTDHVASMTDRFAINDHFQRTGRVLFF